MIFLNALRKPTFVKNNFLNSPQLGQHDGSRVIQASSRNEVTCLSQLVHERAINGANGSDCISTTAVSNEVQRVAGLAQHLHIR